MEWGTEKMIARKDDAIGWMIFNNPERRNAVSKAMWQAMSRIVEAFATDPAVRVIVVRGAGERAFVSGADISEFESVRSTPADIATYDAISDEACLALERVAKPTVAMIHGYCIGGGFDVALRCDARIAAEDARFGIPAARLGLGYPFSDIARVVAHLGPTMTKEIFYSAQQFSAARAYEMGLVNQVVPAAKLEEAVLGYAREIAANAPMTIAAVKKCVGEALKDPAERDTAGCRAMVDACFASADYVEGRRAFMEKRPPAFRGR